MLVGAQMATTAMAQSIPALPPQMTPSNATMPATMMQPMVSQVNGMGPAPGAQPQMALSTPVSSNEAVMNNMVYNSPYSAMQTTQPEAYPAQQYMTMQQDSFWYVNAEALFLHMSKAGDQAVAVNGNGDVVLSTTSRNPGFTPGMRFTLGTMLNEVSTIEATYFGLSQWTSNASYFTDAADLMLPGDLGAGTTDFAASSLFNTTYKSELHNAEINHLWATDAPGIRFITGFRYINLREFYDINSVPSEGISSDYRINTRNNLFGGQIGAKLKKEWGDFGISLTAKTGIYGNSTRQQTYLGDNSNVDTLRDSTTNGTSVAFVSDLNPNLHARINDYWNLRAGMDFMWIAGVARAPNQLDFTNNPPDSGTSLSKHSNVFLYGFNVGLSASF